MTLKNNIVRAVTLLWVAMIIPASLFAQQEYKTTTISVAAGLSQSSVYCITQDKDGFIWTGTQDGLNKYNGISFEIYRNEPFDSMSLPSSIITALLTDSKGRLWVGTENRGLCLFLPEKNQFKSFYSGEKTKTCLTIPVIKCIAEDNQGSVWVGTNNGLFRIRESGDKAQPYAFSFEPAFLNHPDSIQPWVNSILFSGRGRAFVSTAKEIKEIRYEETSLKGLHVQPVILPDISRESGYLTQAMEADPAGNIWLSVRASLFLYELKTGIVKNLFSFPPDVRITAIKHVSSGEIWIATSRNLYTIRQEDVKQVHLHNPDVRMLLPKEKDLSNGIMVLWEDELNKGLLWAGCDVNGLVKLNPVSKKFKSNNLSEITQAPFVFSILEDKPFLWLGTTEGLIRYDESTQRYIKFLSRPDDPKSLASNYVSNLYKDKSGILWAGTSYGLQQIINPRSNHPSFKTVAVRPDRKQPNIRCVTADHSGTLLVALPKKIFRYEKEAGTFKEIIDIAGAPEGRADNVVISSVMEDATGRYWIGTSGGIVFYNSGISKPQWYSYEFRDTAGLRNNLVQRIRQDSRGNTWAATFNGFIKLTVEKNGKLRFRNYSSKEGLANNTVYGFLEDNATGMLWLSTNGGLARFDPAQEKFVNFDMQDGLQSNEFNANALFKNPEGKMFFGGVNGYTEFFPSEIKPDTIPPRVLITGIFQADSKRLIPLSGSSGKQITLPYDQNSLSLEFISLHYADPLKNKYAYKLDGFHKDWIYCGANRQVNFSQLAPGTYFFRVTGSNADGLYSPAGDMLTIVIDPPFWKTFWFYLLLAMLVTILLTVLHRYRLSLKVLQMKEIEKIRKDTAADFHDELGHRLTTISWFSEVMKNKINPEEKELRSYVDKIIDTSANLYHTMKDLVWAMDPKKDTVQDLYTQLKSFGEGIFDQTGIDFVATPAPPNFKNQPLPLIYKRHVLLILKEAMHNSFKHSHCTQTELKLFRENGNYSILFHDNGCGFDLKKTAQGNGLKNITKRADLIHARAQIQSGESGTSLELIFHVPKSNE